MGEFLEFREILSQLNMDKDKFTDMCIAAGCDYLHNIQGIGISKAKKIVCEHPQYLNTFQSLQSAPEDYSKCFAETRIVFHSQTVINPSTCQTVPLNEYQNPMEDELKHLCGKYPFSLIANILLKITIFVESIYMY
jgi:5'-3' exonuclease